MQFRRELRETDGKRAKKTTFLVLGEGKVAFAGI
jgi:hypothetical protein